MPSSYWLEALKLPSASEPKSHYDFIIVGAGIAGLSTAYWLQQENPQSRIAILDRVTLGFGATGRNAGFVTCGSALHFHRLQEKFGLSTAAQIWTFSEKNHQLLLEHVIQEDISALDYQKTGSCTVIPCGSDPQKFHVLLKDMKSVGIAVDKLDSQTLHQQYAVKESDGAIEYHHDGVIHPIKLLNKLAERLQNVDFIWDEEVLQIQETKKSVDVVQVKTIKNTYSAQKIFVAINGYTQRLFPELSSLIQPQRGQILVSEPHPKMIKGPCYLTPHLCYFRQLPTGEILVGGFRNADIESENTDQDKVNGKIQKALENFLKNYFEKTQNIRVSYRWSGIMSFTPDEQMIIGALPQKSNIHIMAGCSGHGMGLSFHAARAMVKNHVPDFFKISRYKL